jgi:hypothetical protein
MGVGGVGGAGEGAPARKVASCLTTERAMGIKTFAGERLFRE